MMSSVLNAASLCRPGRRGMQMPTAATERAVATKCMKCFSAKLARGVSKLSLDVAHAAESHEIKPNQLAACLFAQNPFA